MKSVINLYKNLLKSFGAYATLHVINVTFEDFNENGQAKVELKEILEWYKSINIADVSPTKIILLFRDYLKKNEKQFEVIKKGINSEYNDVNKSNDFVSLLKLENIDKNSLEDDANEKRPFKIKKFLDHLLEI